MKREKYTMNVLALLIRLHRSYALEIYHSIDFDAGASW